LGGMSESLCKNFIEPLVPFADTRLHSGLHHAVTIFHRLIDRMNSDASTSAGQFFQAHCIEGDMSALRHAFKFKGLDHQLFRHFMERTVKAVFIPILVLMNVAILSTTDRYKGFEDHFVSMRTQPQHI